MDEEAPREGVRHLVSAAERLDAMADTAELMGDDDSACRWRAMASTYRLRAMTLLDD